MWNNGAMTMRGESWSAWRQTCPIATLSTWTGLGFNLGLCSDRLQDYYLLWTIWKNFKFRYMYYRYNAQMWPSSEVVSGCQDHQGGKNVMLTGQCYFLCTLPVLLVMWIALPVSTIEPWEIEYNNIHWYIESQPFCYNAT